MTVDPTQPAGPLVVLHEEQLQVITAREATERVLLRRLITTETRQVEVTVRREELVIERLPATDPTPADSTAATSGPLVILLSEEVPVVSMVTRPYERVTIHLETVTEREQVGATLSHEQVEVVTTRAPAERAGG